MRAIVIGLVLAGGVAQAGIYKCKVDGATVYQASPCVDGGKEIIIRKQSGGLSPQSPGGNLRDGEREMARNLDLRNAAKAGKIMVGMDRERVIYAWGKPDKKNYTAGTEQWVYRKNRRVPQYVYFKGGKVTGWN